MFKVIAMRKELAIKSYLSWFLLVLTIYDYSRADNVIIEIGIDAINSTLTISNTSQVHWEEYLLEGDIDLNGFSIASYVDKIDSKPAHLDDFGSLDNSVANKLNLWPNAIVPHEISPEIPETLMFLIAAAIDEIQQLTCIRWIPRRPFERSYVSIVLGSESKPSCRSSIGRLGSVQEIVLSPDCMTKGVVIHEMMHSLGFLHEQSRSDRDEYVSILWENLPDGKENKNFRTYGVDIIDNLEANYDYSSILHGESFIDGVEIIRPIIDVQIGQRERLSETDVYKLNKLYQCVAESDLSPVCDLKIDCVQRAQSGKCFTEPLIMLLECGKFCSLCSKNLKHEPTEVPRFPETIITAPSPILMTSLSDILLTGRWRSEEELGRMTMDDQRNTLIVEMNAHSNMVIPVLQSYDNNRLIGMAAVMLFIKLQSYRNLAQLKEMSYEDQRNTLIVELHKRLGESIGILQGKTNQQLVTLGNEMVLMLWNSRTLINKN